MSWKYFSLQYMFWFFWAIIVGGIAVLGPILAPLAFHTLPTLVGNVQDTLATSSVLMTITFARVAPILAICFLGMCVLANIKIYTEKELYSKKHIFIIEANLLVGLILWSYFAWDITPTMAGFVMDNLSVKYSLGSNSDNFYALHKISEKITKIAFIITLLVPITLRQNLK